MRTVHTMRLLIPPKKGNDLFHPPSFASGSRVVQEVRARRFTSIVLLYCLARYVCVAARFLVLLAPRTAHVCQPRSAPAGVLDDIAPLTATCPAVLATWRATA